MTTLASGTDLTVRPLTARVGAVLDGVRLSPDLDSDTIAVIRRALLTHKVLFVRDQHQLEDADQVGFAERLGQVTDAHPTVPGLPTQSRVLAVDGDRGRADSWHTDVTFVRRPPALTILRPITLPAHGGDTLWANTVSAYAQLPTPLRSLADSLRAVHTNLFDYTDHEPENGTKADEYRQVFRATRYETEHPVVRVHPETGERSLLLGHFVRRFTDLGNTDSARILDLFQRHITGPENVVRWRWRSGDVAIWDNRATQHYAVNDYGDAERRLRRVTIVGDIPVGVDGRHSVALVGDDSQYSRGAASAPA